MKTTGLFVAAAAISLALAWAFRPTVVRTEGEIAAEKRGSMIFPKLDPDVASSFRLTRFNESLATLSRIEMSKDARTDLWTLPSADGYPADSAEQVSQAITPLVDLRVLSTVSTDRGDHALYGVVEPNEQDLTVSASGVGILVNVGGVDNEILASLIIGKKVEGTEGQHFVRVPAEDAVYEVEINADAFVTDLEKWIKGDILNVRGLDIEHVGLRDYAILRTERGYGLGRNFDADVYFKDNKWSLRSFVDHTLDDSPSTDQPPEGTQLQEKPLNELRNNIQNLKIVNVRRKPPGLAADLKADKSLMSNEESTRNLQSQGFFPMETGDVYAAGGELIVGTKDGVQYLLRFGNTRVSSSAMESESEEEDGIQGVNRFLLVTAQLDESKFPTPELKLVPETIEEMLALEAEGTVVDDTIPGEQPPDEETASEAMEPEADDSEALSKDSDQPSTNTTTEESSSDESSPNSSASEEGIEDSPQGDTQPDPDSSQAEPNSEEEFSARGFKQAGILVSTLSPQQEQTDEPSAPESDQESQPKEVENKADTQTVPESNEVETELTPSRQETQEELQERLEFLQETLRKENQRLIDDRNEKLIEARKKVAELNARFADWYYLVSDSVYNKLKVSREALFNSGEAADDTADALDGFELPGLPPGFQLPPSG